MPHHLLDLLDPWEDGTVAWFQREAQAALADIEARGRRALLVGGTALYVQAVVDDLDIPGQYPEVRAELEAEPDTAALHAAAASSSTRWPPSRMEPTNRRRVVRALEVTLGSGRPFSSYGPGPRRPPADRRSRMVGLRREPDDLRARIAARYDAARWRPGSSTRSAACTTTRGACPAPPRQALGYKELLDHLDGDAAPRRGRRPGRPPHRPLRPPPAGLVPARSPDHLARRSSPTRTANLLVDALARTVG